MKWLVLPFVLLVRFSEWLFYEVDNAIVYWLDKWGINND